MPLGANSAAGSQPPPSLLRFQVAPRYPDGCGFTLGRDGTRKPDVHASPRQLGIPLGTTIKMDGSPQCQRKLKGISFMTDSLELFQNEDLYPFLKDRCRPTYIRELRKLLQGKRRDNAKEAWSIRSVGTISMSIDWSSFGADGKSTAVAKISPFHDFQSFRARVEFQVLKVIPHFEERKLAVNGRVLPGELDTYKPIQQALGSDVSGGIISLSGEELETQMKQPKLYGGGGGGPLPRWDMDLAAGGKVEIQVHADDDPKAWNWASSEVISVQIMNSLTFENITAISCPPTPIEISSYLTSKIPFATYGTANSTTRIDSEQGIGTGIVREGDGPIGCLFCEKNLCDSL